MSVAVDEQAFLLGDWKVEPSLNRIARGEEVVKIDPRNMQVLQLLASKPGHVFSQAEIEEAVWADVVVTPNSVYQAVAQLRRALGERKDKPRYIETISRRGYRVAVKVHAYDASSSVLDHEAAADTSAQELRLSPKKQPHVVGPSVLILVMIVGFAAFYELRENDVVDLSSHELRVQEPTQAEDIKRKHLSARQLYDLGIIALTHGDAVAARSRFQEAVEMQRELVGIKDPYLGVLLSGLAKANVWDSDYEAAEEAARAALVAFENGPEFHADRIEAVHLLGYALRERGRYEEAEFYTLDALSLSKRVFGETSEQTAEMMKELAFLRHSQNRIAEAEELARKSRSLLRQTTSDVFTLSHANQALVWILLDKHQYQEAKHEAEQDLLALRAAWNDDHPYVVAVRDLLGKSLIGLGEYSAAEDVFRRNIDLWSQNERFSMRVAASTSGLAESLLAQGKVMEAEEYLLSVSTVIERNRNRGRHEDSVFREHKARMQKLHLAKAERLQGSAQLLELTTRRHTSHSGAVANAAEDRISDANE